MRKRKPDRLILEGGATAAWTDPTTGEEIEVFRFSEAETFADFTKLLVSATHEVTAELKLSAVRYNRLTPHELPTTIRYTVFYPNFNDLDSYASGGSTQYVGSLMVAAYSITEYMYRSCSRFMKTDRDVYSVDYSVRSDDFTLDDSIDTALALCYTEKDYADLFSEHGITSEEFHSKYVKFVKKGRRFNVL